MGLIEGIGIGNLSQPIQCDYNRKNLVPNGGMYQLPSLFCGQLINKVKFHFKSIHLAMSPVFIKLFSFHTVVIFLIT